MIKVQSIVKTSVRKIKQSFYFELLLCALMWNISFFAVHLTNSLFVLSLALLSIPVFGYTIAKISFNFKRPLKKALVAGSIWGATCLGMQTIWFLLLHLYFPTIYGPKLIVAWLGSVIMFAGLGALYGLANVGLCKAVMRTKNRLSHTRTFGWLAWLDKPSKSARFFNYFLTVLLLQILWPPFSWYLSSASFWPTMQMLGYPFFSPMLPIENAIKSNTQTPGETNDFKWIEPVGYKECLSQHRKFGFSAEKISNAILDQVKAHCQEWKNKNGQESQNLKPLVLMAPESTFPFKINQYPDFLQNLSSALVPNSVFLLGTYRIEDDGKIYQTTAMIGKSGILAYMDKKYLTPLAESRFTPGADPSMPNVAKLGCGQEVMPLVCFEFFSKPRRINNASQKQIPVIFANDFWYPEYMKVLMRNLAIRAARTNNKPLVYLSHYKKYCLGI